MAITDRAIDQAFSDLKQTCGGVRNDYFGLLYLEEEFGLDRDRALNQVTFGSNDYGIDGFHFDREKRNLYLFQFKWSESHAQFKQSFKRLIDAGMERIFGGGDPGSATEPASPAAEELPHRKRSCHRPGLHPLRLRGRPGGS
jgi:hypothetical protein